jgi:hypothetical protein
MVSEGKQDINEVSLQFQNMIIYIEIKYSEDMLGEIEKCAIGSEIINREDEEKIKHVLDLLANESPKTLLEMSKYLTNSEIKKWCVDALLSKCRYALKRNAKILQDLENDIGSFLGQRGLWTPN